MTNCGCHELTDKVQKKVLLIAFVLNFAMFCIELIGGIYGHSTGLLADSLDMLSDASVYALAAFATKYVHLKNTAAKSSGILLLILGGALFLEVVHRFWNGTDEPISLIMILFSTMGLLVNLYVLSRLNRLGKKEVHIRAAWIFTRADVIANLGVLISGVIIAVTGSHYPDLVIGFLISLYVIKEAYEILHKDSLHS